MSTEHNQETQEHTTEQTPQEHAQDTPETVQDDTQQADEPKGNKAHRDAAKYRTQLRETEASLENITGQRNQLAQQVIENNLGNMKPAVFWKLAGEVTDYINDDGTVNLDKVAEAAKTIGDDLGINTGPTIPGQEKRPGKINAGNSLHKAFEPR